MSVARPGALVTRGDEAEAIDLVSRTLLLVDKARLLGVKEVLFAEDFLPQASPPGGRRYYFVCTEAEALCRVYGALDAAR